MEIFDRLSQFMCRAGIIEVGRDRLIQVRKKLECVLVTEDLSENSLSQMLKLFDCPVYRALTMSEVERYFKLRGTKVLGFRRHSLSKQVHQALKGKIVHPMKALPERPRVAVLGASGIGRWHGSWWAMEGAEVVAFLGQNEDRLQETEQILQQTFGFSGKGYLSLDELLEQEQPDVVDVCLPPSCHYDATVKALSAGCHVLCEKPFFYDVGLSSEELLQHSRNVASLAYSKGLRFGGCTQYVIAAKEVLELWRKTHPNEGLERFDGTLVSPLKGREPDARQTWVDLAPHMLAVAQVLSNHGQLDFSSIERRFEGANAEVAFQCQVGRQRCLDCHISTRHSDGNPSHVRQISLNGQLYDIGGMRDKNGIFQMSIRTPEGEERQYADMMRLLIRDFMKGKIDVPHSFVYANMEWLLATLERDSSCKELV